MADLGSGREAGVSQGMVRDCFVPHLVFAIIIITIIITIILIIVITIVIIIIHYYYLPLLFTITIYHYYCISLHFQLLNYSDPNTQLLFPFSPFHQDESHLGDFSKLFSLAQAGFPIIPFSYTVCPQECFFPEMKN